MIITCPHCQTKYQVTFEAIGSAGRKVQCAHCSQAWNQQPLEPEFAPKTAEGTDASADRLFDDMAEDALDELLSAEERAASAEKAAVLPKAAEPPQSPPRAPDAAEMKKRQVAFSRRQSAMISRLPLARLRRTARFIGVVGFVGLLAGGYFARVQIVERYPDLAGVYEAIGLGVNVVGLEFSDLATLKTLSSGNDVLMVSAQIVGLEPKPVPVPPIVVSLLDDAGHAVYEWSVSPQVSNLMAGERATFDTRLSLPPSEAVRVRLSFAGGNAQSASSHGSAPEPVGAAAPAATGPQPTVPVHEHNAASAPAAHAPQTHH